MSVYDPLNRAMAGTCNKRIKVASLSQDAGGVPPYLPISLKRKPNTWDTIFLKALERGDDHGYAAFLADQWEKRQAKKLCR